MVYSVKCSEYDQEHISEIARMLGTRFREHTSRKTPQLCHRWTHFIHWSLLHTGWHQDHGEGGEVAPKKDLRSHQHSQEIRCPQPRPQDPPHPPPTPVTWPAGHVTSHSTIVKDHVTWSQSLSMFQTCFCVINSLIYYLTNLICQMQLSAVIHQCVIKCFVIHQSIVESISM